MKIKNLSIAIILLSFISQSNGVTPEIFGMISFPSISAKESASSKEDLGLWIIDSKIRASLSCIHNVEIPEFDLKSFLINLDISRYKNNNASLQFYNEEYKKFVESKKIFYVKIVISQPAEIMKSHPWFRKGFIRNYCVGWLPVNFLMENSKFKKKGDFVSVNFKFGKDVRKLNFKLVHDCDFLGAQCSHVERLLCEQVRIK